MILIWILLICWGLWLLAPYIGRWLMKLLQRRVHNHIYKHMGLDPSSFGHKNKDERDKPNRRRYDTHHYRHTRRKIIPDGYGEYVPFTVHALTGDEAWLDTAGSPVYVNYSEPQISEAHWEELT